MEQTNFPNKNKGGRRKIPVKKDQILTGLLNHIAANLNQIAKKRNSNEQLSDDERERLSIQSPELMTIALTIKNYFK